MIMQFQIGIAGKAVNIFCLYDRVRYRCEDYLTHEEISDFSVYITRDDLKKEEAIINAEGDPRVSFTSDLVLEDIAVYRKICDEMLNYSTLLMHGAVIAYEGNAYMFAARSGVGKSTRAELWLKEYPGSVVVNGDKPLIRITEDQAIACGTPWSGKEGWNTNIMVPLKAIFLLERADDGDESSIAEVSFEESFPGLLQQVHHPDNSELMRKALLLLQSLRGKVKIYKFRSTPSPEAIHLAYETAR